MMARYWMGGDALSSSQPKGKSTVACGGGGGAKMDWGVRLGMVKLDIPEAKTL
jgi:hypothetical protein